MANRPPRGLTNFIEKLVEQKVWRLEKLGFGKGKIVVDVLCYLWTGYPQSAMALYINRVGWSYPVRKYLQQLKSYMNS